MNIKQTLSFRSTLKKLHKNELLEVEFAIRTIMANPLIGTRKVADLSGVLVYKFRVKKCLQLLAYTWSEENDELTLLKLGSHENFYRDLKSHSA